MRKLTALGNVTGRMCCLLWCDCGQCGGPIVRYPGYRNIKQGALHQPIRITKEEEMGSEFDP